MEIRDLLLHLQPGSDQLEAAENFGLALAQQFGAHLTAAGLALIYTGDGVVDAGAGAWAADMAEQSRGAAMASFERLRSAASPSVGTELVLIECAEFLAAEQFARLARHFDMSVVGQGSPGDEDRWVAAASLFGSGRGVFVIPDRYVRAPAFDRALVCWDGGLPAARALACAMGLLKRANQVEVVTVATEEEMNQTELPGFDIARHLARHDIPVTLKKLPPTNKTGESLLARAEDYSADYMVMGGYGHWRWSEFVLGGTTRSVLRSMERPVLFAH